MPTRFKDKVVLVTGGGGGIGRATALAFAGEGAQVIIADLSAAQGEDAVREVSSLGNRSLFIQADVSKPNEVKDLIRKVIDQFGRLDIAFNNAGIRGKWARTADLSEENWDRVIETNLKSAWLCMKYEIPEMLKYGGGAIVNMASVLGLSGFAKLPAYSASKHGIIGLTKSAAVEYAGKGVRINAVCPGYINTPLLQESPGGKEEKTLKGVMKNIQKKALYSILKKLEPSGRFGTPEEVAKTVLWLSSSDASFMTGQIITIDGGHLTGRTF